jgi:hypothetical protein
LTEKPQLVFIGCPWRTIRPKYERIISKRTYKRRYPLAFVIIGREGNQRAEDLFSEIKKQIDRSSCAILDVSGGNANVALEFGYAEGRDIKTHVFVNEHKKFAQDRGLGSSLISDLSGVRRNAYKNERSLEVLVKQFAQQHPYTQRVEKSIHGRELSLDLKAALMAIPRAFKDKDKMRRADLRDDVLSEAGCSEEVASSAIEEAKRGSLIEVSVGQHGYTTLIP